MKRTCLKCNTTKEHRDWYKHDSGHWCASCHCKEQYKKSKSKLKDRKCRHCDNDFTPRRKDNIYCSKLCGDQAARVDKKKTNKYFRDKYKNDINRRLKQATRTRINKALNGSYKLHNTIESLGCSPEELKKHLEAQFQEGMTWDNWSPTGWHIDHIEPLARFDLTNPEEYKKACHYTNLQPLWAKDNLAKGDR